MLRDENDFREYFLRFFNWSVVKYTVDGSNLCASARARKLDLLQKIPAILYQTDYAK